MALYLFRLGRLSFRRRTTVLAVWLLVLTALGGLAAGFGRSADAQLTIPGVESVAAGELLAERFPGGSAGGASARLVFAAPDGGRLTDAAARTAITETLAEAAAAPQVAGVSDPYATGAVSRDGGTAYATVTYGVQVDAITDAAREGLVSSTEAAEAAGVRVELGGEATQAVAEQAATEALGVLVALGVLAVTFGSLLAAGLPLLTALIGVGAGMAGVTALSALVDLTSTAPTLGLMIGLAVGIDYALFIGVRHKQQLAEGMDPQESAGRAVGTAGSAVVFAGATVMIALAGLAVVGIPFLTSMGLVAAGMVAVAVLVALTLVPALLGFAGDRFHRWPVRGLRRRQVKLRVNESAGTRWARTVTRRPLPVLLGAVLGLGVLALPALDLRLGLPDEGNLSASTTQRQAYDLLAEGFGPGFNGPLTVVVDATGAADPQGAAAATAAAARTLPEVALVSPPAFNPAGDTAVLTVVPNSGPAEASTRELVGALRDLRPDLTATTGSELSVTGNTALGIDISDKLTGALPVFLLVVVGLALVLLTVAFRSLLVPLKATGGFLLSLAATFGALVAVFQWGWLADLIGLQQTGPDHQLPAHPADRPALRPGDGLRGLPRQPDARGARARRDAGRGRDRRLPARRPRRHRRGTHHGRRSSAGSSSATTRPSRASASRWPSAWLIDAFVVRMAIVPAAMALLGRPGVVPAALAGPRAAERRHRGRRPGAAGAVTGRRPGPRADRRPPAGRAHRTVIPSGAAPVRCGAAGADRREGGTAPACRCCRHCSSASPGRSSPPPSWTVPPPWVSG